MQLQIGDVYTGKVTTITGFGAFVQLPEGKTGMIHISEVAATFVKEIRDHLSEGQEVQVKVINVDEQGRVSLSIKRLQLETENSFQPEKRRPRPQKPVAVTSPGNIEWTPRRSEPVTFEDMMSRFKTESDEKISAIRRQADGKRGARKR